MLNLFVFVRDGGKCEHCYIQKKVSETGAPYLHAVIIFPARSGTQAFFFPNASALIL
jgi:hypothetical protein